MIDHPFLSVSPASLQTVDPVFNQIDPFPIIQGAVGHARLLVITTSLDALAHEVALD